MRSNRRVFLKHAGFITLSALISQTGFPNRLLYSGVRDSKEEFGFGPLKRDQKGVLDLPKGFDYKIISGAGDKMDDGFYVPDRTAIFLNNLGTGLAFARTCPGKSKNKYN